MNEELKRIDCQDLKKWLLSVCQPDQEKHNTKSKSKIQDLLDLGNLALNEYINLRTEGKTYSKDKKSVILDLRTYICANGKCQHHNDRKHSRITNYNYKKMISLYMKINLKLDNITNEIIYIWMQDKNTSTTDTNITNFVKETARASEQKPSLNVERYKPIETVFAKIDEMAEQNNQKLKSKEAAEAPGQKITKLNTHRMTYGDINYLGSNKAIFYFNRGIRGIQNFTNSTDSIKHQPPHKDVVVIDDIVFTSNCKCDSALQHKQMFPHYRVTCAVGLTCPARLNSYERIAFARTKNATTETFTTARSMLVRRW